MNFEGCKLIRAVDGDTYDVWVPVEHMLPETPIWTPRIRCSYINAPERKTGRPWQEAKDGLTFKLQDKPLTITTHGRDSFKRLLAETFIDGEPLSTWMIDSGFAVKFSLALQLAQ